MAPYWNLVAFLGYGPDSPSLVFYGYDEYCDHVALSLNFRVRRDFPRRYDKNDACCKLEEECLRANLVPQAQGYKQARVPGANVPTWTFAAMFSQRFFDRGLTWNEEYKLLGAREPDARVFLVERFPLPRPSHRYVHPNRNARALTLERRTILKRDLIALLPRATVFVSYAGRPTDVLGAMQRQGGRAWKAIAGSRRDRTLVEIARTTQCVALSVPFPRKGHEDRWTRWLGAAVDAAKAFQTEMLTSKR